MVILALSPSVEGSLNHMSVVNDAERQSWVRRAQAWLGLAAMLTISSMYVFAGKEEPILEAKIGIEDKINAKQCPSFCEARSKQLLSHHRGDLLDPRFLLEKVEEERTHLRNKLKEDYGEEAFTSMWVDKENGSVIGARTCVSPDPNSDVSYRMFRRKLLMKVLKVQISILDEQKNLRGCDCTSHNTPTDRRLQKTLDLPKVPTFYQRFVWSTGGHSAAAAHGNLFNESYTAYLEQAVKGVFQSIGIEFEGRNYAMGGMDSAPQIALCNEAVFGTDADVISWDFGMTDGGAHWKTNLYASRAGVHTNRPVHFSINNAGRNYGNRMKMLKFAEEAGVPTLQLLPSVDADVSDGIPDSFGLSYNELQKLGPFARYFKCKGAIEKGDDCGTFKYSNQVCPDRKFKASWHPGWKQHAVTGNILALFVTESMKDAMEFLVQSGQDPRELIAKLRAEEDQEYEKFFKSNVPDETEGFISPDLVAAGVKSQYFFRHKAVCKTSLLPAQTRYLGVLTDSNEQDGQGYFKGIDSTQAAAMISSPIDENKLTLVFDADSRQKCSVDLNIDYKDYFYSKDSWGWASLSFPGKAEKELYAPSRFNPVGLVVVCFVKCDWGKCLNGNVAVETFNKDWKMELDGEPVTELSQIDQCFLLKTRLGYFHKPNASGQYVLRVWIDKSDSMPARFVRITSLIVI